MRLYKSEKNETLQLYRSNIYWLTKEMLVNYTSMHIYTTNSKKLQITSFIYANPQAKTPKTCCGPIEGSTFLASALGQL